MSLSYQQKTSIRFGGFELDHSGELRSQGRKVKLQEQPSQILRILTGLAYGVEAARAG